MIGTESKRGFKGFPLGFYYGLPYQPVTAGSNPARFRKGIDCSKTFKNKFEVRNMNELLQIAELLENKYGDNSHFLITKAEKTENGWNITIQPAKENGGAANESN